MRSDTYVACEVTFKFATKDAILIAQDGSEHWVPRSVLNYSTDREIDKYGKNQDVNISLREWFVEKVGLR